MDCLQSQSTYGKCNWFHWKLSEFKCEIHLSFIDAIYSNDLDWGEICPPACSETKYYSSIATVPKSNADGDSVVNVFFKDSSIIKYKRVELYKITDIICKYISDFYKL